MKVLGRRRRLTKRAKLKKQLQTWLRPMRRKKTRKG